MHIIRRPDTGGCVDRPSGLGGNGATARRATEQKPCKRRKGEVMLCAEWRLAGNGAHSASAGYRYTCPPPRASA